VITDLVQIKLLGEKKRPENERFRKHMKSFDHSDRILRRIAEGIEDQIDCLECANCCRVATARVTERDVERLAKYLHIKPARVMADYVLKSEEEGLILQRDVPHDLQGRVFAVKETAGSWGFGLAFVGGGALASALEPSQVFLIAGSGAIVVALATAMMLRRRRAAREAVEAVG